MGRSTSSCFKIITCAGDSDDLEAPKSNDSGDKRGWSFRKRSARNQVISNTVILEAPSINNDSPHCAPLNFQSQANSSDPEKTSIMECTNDITNLSAPVSSKLSDIMVATKEDDNGDNPDNSVITIIQAGIRGFLARRSVLKQKNIVKLQAAVRGHLVRRHAVGTLRCVVAIARMQALVRARRVTRVSVEGPSIVEENVDKKQCKSNQHSKLLQKRNPGTQQPTYVSIAKLLSNSFARQLLESTPRNKSINIKCDPSSSDTAWKWLERWMAVSPGVKQSPTLELGTEIKEHHSVKHPENQVETVASPSEDKATLVASESEENLPQHEKSDFHPIQATKSEYIHQGEPFALSDNPGLKSEEAKTFATGQSEAGAMEFASLSRKTSNPAFIAAQSKFEELTSTPTNKDNEIKTGDNDLSESSILHISKAVHVGGSECGTELSVTSTLDSPDRAEVEAAGSEMESMGTKNIEMGAEVDPTISPKPEKNDESNGTHNEESSTDLQIEMGPKAVNQGYKSSPEASPRSHITVLESQGGTPSSQVSTKTKKSRDNRTGTGLNPKRKSFSAKKRSPINSSQDLSGNSFERLPKGQRTGKHRNSFGSPRPDGIEQDLPRDSSSSNSLPSYMQATESAKAKALVSTSSPRSSPDVQDKEIYMKKRHSLPGANGRQGSPRIQRSLSQAQHSAKEGTHSQERKWQR